MEKIPTIPQWGIRLFGVTTSWDQTSDLRNTYVAASLLPTKANLHNLDNVCCIYTTEL